MSNDASSTDSEVVLSIDVEWAHPVVLDDVVTALDERGLRGTFFCTHEGISVPGHERALHPNFRRQGNTQLDGAVAEDSELGFRQQIVDAVRGFCPEAVGVRAHSLFCETELLSVYRAAGLEYDSSAFLPLVPGIAPFVRGLGIVELPLYYMDHWDLMEQATALGLSDLRLDAPGLKVVGFHPNLVYLNATTEGDYLDSKAHYHDPDWLLRHRRPGRGVRTLFHALLDRLASGPAPPTLGEVNTGFRSGAAFEGGA
jgi:polysaccharide deactylase WbmS-like protein